MFVIRDSVKGGYAVKDPIEGWIFSTTSSHAATFPTEVAAAAAIGFHFGNLNPKPIVERL